MATVNPFDLLGDDDNDDPTQLIALQQQKILAGKAAPPPEAAEAAKMPMKPLPSSQAGREDKRNNAVPRGGSSGRGRPGRISGGRGGGLAPSHEFVNGNVNGVAGSYGGGVEGGRGEEGDGGRPTDRERGPYSGPHQPVRGGRRSGYGNGEVGGDLERPRRTYERRSGTGRGYEMKREGAGRGNWGTATDDAFTQEREDNVNADEKIASPEKQQEQEDAPPAETGKENKEGQANESEEKEKEAKEMTLEEYEKIREEKRKALLVLKSEERKVEIDNELKSMQQLSLKKGNDSIFIKLGSDKEKKKENTERNERAKKSLSINEFLKPAEGERYYGGGRGRGRGRGRGDRGSFEGGFGSVVAAAAAGPAPLIEDPNQFPTLGAK